MLINGCYDWQLLNECCWKCGGRIWYNNNEDKYSFVPNDPDCLCEIRHCHFCNSIEDLELLTRVWQQHDNGWQVEYEHIWLCEDCLGKNGFCEDCGDVMIGKPDVEYQCPECEIEKRLKEAA